MSVLVLLVGVRAVVVRVMARVVVRVMLECSVRAAEESVNSCAVAGQLELSWYCTRVTMLSRGVDVMRRDATCATCATCATFSHANKERHDPRE